MIGYRKVIVALAYLGCSTYVMHVALAASLSADDIVKLILSLSSGLALYVYGNLRKSSPTAPDA